MSFRRRKWNRRDAWNKHCEESASQLAEIGLPIEVFASEQSLAEFLSTGYREDLSLDLDTLPEPQFWKLFRFADSWFDSEAAGFKALERRRLSGHHKSNVD